MLKRTFIAALFLAAIFDIQPAFAADSKARPQVTWWECFHFFQIEGVDPELSGRLVRAIRLDGQSMTDTYEMWNRDLRITWREDARTAGASGRVGSISIAIPPPFSAEGQGIFGYLYGDDQFVGMTTMLDPHFARQGYAAASAFFQGEEIE